MRPGLGRVQPSLPGRSGAAVCSVGSADKGWERAGPGPTVAEVFLTNPTQLLPVLTSLGRYFIIYNQCDSYPSGLGRKITKDIPKDPEEFKSTHVMTSTLVDTNRMESCHGEMA